MSFFTPNIEKLKARQDVKGLIRALSHKDKTIAQAAEQAIVSLGSLAMEPLSVELKSTGTLSKGDLWLDTKAYSIVLERQKKILELLCRIDVAALIMLLRNHEGRLTYPAPMILAYLCMEGFFSVLSPLLHTEFIDSRQKWKPLSVELIPEFISLLDKSITHEKAIIKMLVDLCLSDEEVKIALSSTLWRHGRLDKFAVIEAIASANPQALLRVLNTPSLHSSIHDEQEFAMILKRLGGVWGTEGILFFSLTLSVGQSWEETRLRLLEMIQDRTRAVEILINLLDEHKADLGRDVSTNINYVTAVLYSLFALLKISTAKNLLFRDYDTVDVENKSLEDGLVRANAQHEKSNQECFRVLKEGINSGKLSKQVKDLERIKEICENLTKHISFNY